MNKWTAFILGYLVAISIIVSWNYWFIYTNKEKDCQKTSTQAIFIEGKITDVEFCEKPIVKVIKVIKQYK